MNDPGTYVQHNGRPAVRFVRTYPHSVDRLWQAIVDPAQSTRWFPSTLAIEPRVDGVVTFSGDPHMPDSTGSVLAYDPPREVAFTWGADEVHLRLSAADDGGCVLTLINVLDEAPAAARNAAGWTVCLLQLERLVAGDRPGGPHAPDADEWRPHYESYVAAGLPSGAPLPG